MNQRYAGIVLCILAHSVLLIGLAGPISAGEQNDSPFAPVIKAAEERRDAAQRRVVELRARYTEAAEKQKALEKQLQALAEKRGLRSDAGVAALQTGIDRAEARLVEVARELKAQDPAALTTLAQFAQYDQRTDERAALKRSIEEMRSRHGRLLRHLLRADPEGTALVEELERVEVQAIAMGHEEALAQMRRDGVSRSVGGFIALLSPNPEPAQPAKLELLRPDVPAVPDAEARKRQFEARNSPDGLKSLGQRFFSEMSLDLPGLEKVAAKVAAADYVSALDEYRAYFFGKLLSSADENPADGEEMEDPENGSAAAVAFRAPTKERIQANLDGEWSEDIEVPGHKARVAVRWGAPGAIHWVFIDPQQAADADRGELLLEFCRRQSDGGHTFVDLLHSYATGGPLEHLLRWSEVTDDWAVNWRQDADRSPLAIRNYNVLYVTRIQGLLAKLRMIAQMRPAFATELPSATLARLLIAMNEEYLSSSIRLARSGLYNFRIMAVNSMVPTSLRLREFHVHQWAVREGWRLIDTNFIHKIRRDGANFEFANDGHENTDQGLIRPFRIFQNTKPDWLQPWWDREFLESLASNARYWVHNLKQDGYSYRLNYRSQRFRYLGQQPEYRVDLLSGEDEVQRRLWSVFGVGRPQDLPRVNSEGMAFQGYYYLREGWKKDDNFIYFQSIGQPILSGREDDNGFSLLGKGGLLMQCPAIYVDGRTQNRHYGQVYLPGGKANFAAYGKPGVVRPNRFLAGPRFDFAESSYEGVYQYHRPSTFFDAFGSYGYENSIAKAEGQAKRAGKPFVDEPIKDVRHTRQIIPLHGRDLYIVTDVVESAQERAFAQHYTLYTPVRKDRWAKRLELLNQAKLEPLVLKQDQNLLTTHNVGLWNVQVRQFGQMSLKHTVSPGPALDNIKDSKEDLDRLTKSLGKRERQASEDVIQMNRQVAIRWSSAGRQVLVTLVSTQGRSYVVDGANDVLGGFTPLGKAPGMTGFAGKLADGTEIKYLASIKPARLDLGTIQATASALLLAGDAGLALDCSAISCNGKDALLRHTDFEFRVDENGVTVVNPIYRPIQPVVIEPLASVFLERQEVKLSCATPGVEIRYTLDGTTPTPKSTPYTGPFTVEQTCRLKARAIRPGLTEIPWAQDGTHATVVTSTVLEKRELLPAVEAPRVSGGLRFDYFDGLWTELMARSLSMPAKETGVVRSLLDVSARKTDGPFGIRYDGFLEVPRDGVYTFHAPDEFIYPDIESGYDLRVFVDGHEWYPATRWHGHGCWSVPLQKGKHRFRVVFVDLRHKAHRIELMWGFPHPDFTWKGVAPKLLISGPGMEKQAIPDGMLFREE